MNRWIAPALVLAATLLLSGCATIQAVTQRIYTADPVPEVEVRPTAPPEYDVLVAQQHEARGDVEQALGAFQRALEKDPDSAYLHRKIAAALIRMGRPSQALEHAELALVLEPDEERTRIFLGRLHRLRRDALAAESTLLGADGEPISDEAAVLLYQVYLETDQTQKAVHLAQGLIDRNPDFIAGYAALGKAYERLGEFEKSEEVLRLALEHNPDNLAIYSQLARSARERGDHESEAAVYREILEDRPHHHATLMALADVQIGQDDMDGAIRTLSEIVANYPNDLRSVERLGFLHYEAENFSESVRLLEAVLESEPEDSEVRFFLGIVQRRVGNDARAVEAFNAISFASDHYSEARTQLAVLYEQAGDFGRALEEIERAVAANPTRPRELYAATLRAKAGDFDGAVAYLEGLLLKNPRDDELLYNLGAVYGEAKRTQEALEYMERAIDRNPKNASALNWVGYTLAEQGSNLDQAEAYIVRALDLRPDDGFIIDSLGWVYYMRARPLFDTGREAEAKRYVDRALEELLRAQKLTGGDPVVSEHLGDAYLLLNQKERALENYLEALELEPRDGEQPNLLDKLEALQRELE
jgi:tetratricopeptide (TPR) repeat protein